MGSLTPAPILPGTILAVTRDVVAQDLLSEVALERGYGLCCRELSADAMRVLVAEPPAVLVIDMDAPGARDFFRSVRANPVWRAIPLLALTATNNPMIAVSLDAPIFFLPELVGLEQALATHLDPPPSLGPGRDAPSSKSSS